MVFAYAYTGIGVPRLEPPSYFNTRRLMDPVPSQVSPLTALATPLVARTVTMTLMRMLMRRRKGFLSARPSDPIVEPFFGATSAPNDRRRGLGAHTYGSPGARRHSASQQSGRLSAGASVLQGCAFGARRDAVRGGG